MALRVIKNAAKLYQIKHVFNRNEAGFKYLRILLLKLNYLLYLLFSKHLHLLEKENFINFSRQEICPLSNYETNTHLFHSCGAFMRVIHSNQ